MREKSIVLFADNVFFSEAMSTIIQAKHNVVIKFSEFSQLMLYLPESNPFILMVTDQDSFAVTKSQIEQIKRYHPGVVVALFTYHLLSEREVKELKRIPKISLISLKNSLEILDIVLDVLFAGYHVYDAHCVTNLDSSNMRRDKVLSPMESRVLTMMTRGISVRDMSKTLNIAEKTVMTYKRRFLCKLGAHSLRDCLLP